jgi:hypothetical protein
MKKSIKNTHVEYMYFPNIYYLADLMALILYYGCRTIVEDDCLLGFCAV